MSWVMSRVDAVMTFSTHFKQADRSSEVNRILSSGAFTNHDPIAVQPSI